MSDNVGLVSLKELRERKEAGSRGSTPQTPESPGPAGSPRVSKSTGKPSGKPNTARKQGRKTGRMNLSFDVEDGDAESAPVLVRKRDPGADTSSLKTKKQQKEHESLREQQEQEIAKRTKQEREETIDFPFVYFDGNSEPSSVQVKKGDPIWTVLDKTRRGRKQFHRGTVDDILLVRHNIIIPHNYDLYYFHSSKVQTKIGPLFDLDNLTGDISHTKVVHRTWYDQNKHIYPCNIWKEFRPDVDLVERDRFGFVLHKQIH